MHKNNATVQEARRAAIMRALEEIKDGMVLGLGSGTTVAQLIEELGKIVRGKGLRISVIPSSYQSYHKAIEQGLKITWLDENPNPDLVIDSFDQVDSSGNAIKGGGAALMREKILCAASRRVILVGDEKKLVANLNMPVPVEVLPFAKEFVMQYLRKIGGNPKLREGTGKVGPIITDNGNMLIDVNFGVINDPEGLDTRLHRIPGLLETGIFVGMAHRIIIGKSDGNVREILQK